MRPANDRPRKPMVCPTVSRIETDAARNSTGRNLTKRESVPVAWAEKDGTRRGSHGTAGARWLKPPRVGQSSTSGSATCGDNGGMLKYSEGEQKLQQILQSRFRAGALPF